MKKSEKLRDEFDKKMDGLWDSWVTFCTNKGTDPGPREVFEILVWAKMAEHINKPETQVEMVERLSRQTYERYSEEERQGGVFVGERVRKGDPEVNPIPSAIEECERCHKDMWVSLKMADAFRAATKHLCMDCVVKVTGKSKEQLVEEALGNG